MPRMASHAAASASLSPRPSSARIEAGRSVRGHEIELNNALDV